MNFLDASVLLAAEDSEDREHEASLVLLRAGDVGTIDLALYETTNVAIGRWQDPEAAARLRARIWTIAELGTLIRVDESLGEEVAKLAVEDGLGAYDAAYVAGARRLGAVLASCDQRDLVNAGYAQLPTALSA